MAAPSAHLRIGIDTGGTFTDIVCVDQRSGAMRVTKVASTPANPAIGLVRGVNAGDYSLVLGIASISIIAVATAVFAIDLLYPLLDPRVKVR